MKTTPHRFVTGNDGTLAYQGAMDDRAAVDALPTGWPVAVTKTKSYGCAVHYAE